MSHVLPTRPNLEHFRGQAKTLLAELRTGDLAAAQAFIDHLPKARDLSAEQARSAGFRLADAQSVVARRSGFPSWTALTRHVEHLRSLEGAWSFDALQVDGNDMAPALIAQSMLLFDGDRFRMESPEGNYDGRFAIDTSSAPMQLDIEFVEGPEAGNSSYGIFELADDRLTICLGLVGAPRPIAFATQPMSGHALERLSRTSAQRPSGVTGGIAAPKAEEVDAPDSPVSPHDFSATTTPMLRRLEGAWACVRMVTNGEEMKADWLPFGSRTTSGNEATVVFGGQVMLDVKMRIDEAQLPIAVDYLHLRGKDKGKVSLGIMDWVGDDCRFHVAKPGQARPTDFSAPGAGETLSQWKRVPDATHFTRT
ncbi:MAG: TIGR03067 domain-containing protein [Gemmatimonadota bacterium]